MDTYQFITSISWAVLGFIALVFFAYLILSGRLKWVQYNSVIGKIGLQVASNLGMKDLSADEILAFEGFVYQDLENVGRGSRLAFILLFLEKDLLEARYQDNTLQIELTEKGNQLHLTILAECEKKLMISPKTEIQWKEGGKVVLNKKAVGSMEKEKKTLSKLEKKSKEEKILTNIEEKS